MKPLILVLSVVLVLYGCNQSDKVYDKPYFDFDSLVNKQVAILVEAQVVATKQAMINGKSDEAIFSPDSTQLAHELDVFRQLDVINKPLFKNRYEITVGEKDTLSNLFILTYQATGPAPVPYVKFYYQRSPTQPKKIESHYLEQNSLYATERVLLMEFDDALRPTLLTHYRMVGSQKMVMNDTVHFSVDVLLSPNPF